MKIHDAFLHVYFEILTHPPPPPIMVNGGRTLNQLKIDPPFPFHTIIYEVTHYGARTTHFYRS